MKLSLKISMLAMAGMVATSWTQSANALPLGIADHIEGVTIQNNPPNNGSRPEARIIDHSGLDALGNHSTNQNADMWDTLGGRTGPVTVDFDLGATIDLGNIHVWNWNPVNGTGRGAKDVEILVASTDGGAFVSLGNFVFQEAPGALDPGFDVDLTGFALADVVHDVRFVISTNFFGTLGDTSLAGDNRLGMAEVQFFEHIVTVPEPTTVALGMLGIAGIAMRRRRVA